MPGQRYDSDTRQEEVTQVDDSLGVCTCAGDWDPLCRLHPVHPFEWARFRSDHPVRGPSVLIQGEDLGPAIGHAGRGTPALPTKRFRSLDEREQDATLEGYRSTLPTDDTETHRAGDKWPEPTPRNRRSTVRPYTEDDWWSEPEPESRDGWVAGCCREITG